MPAFLPPIPAVEFNQSSFSQEYEVITIHLLHTYMYIYIERERERGIDGLKYNEHKNMSMETI